MRTWLAAQYETMCHVNLEADDVMGILMTYGSYKDPIMVTADKDMRTVPGALLRMDKMEVNTLDDANRNWMTQALVGDTSDNYPGLKGFGPVKAEKLLAGCKTLPAMWDAVVWRLPQGWWHLC
jgi:DNA polymerase I